MGIPAYTHTTLPFIASIVIGTIQLGATVDYAILMTTKYKKLRYNGADKREADCDGTSQFHPVDHCQCAQLLCSDLRCRHVFQY